MMPTLTDWAELAWSRLHEHLSVCDDCLPTASAGRGFVFCRVGADLYADAQLLERIALAPRREG